MSEAPAYRGAKIMAITLNDVEVIVTFDPSYKFIPWRFDNCVGFSGDELKGWRPL